ncbi:MAG: nucleotide exchange factor GrpE [Clostridium beijerinckii]
MSKAEDILIDNELKYFKKKTLDINPKENIMQASVEMETLNAISEIKRIQRDAEKQNQAHQKEMKKIQRDTVMQNQVQQQEFEVLYKEKLASLEKENLEYKNEIKELKNTEAIFIKKIIAIIDEFEKLKIYADESGNEKLASTIGRNFKIVNKQLSDMGIEKILALGELFNENYHDCVDVVEDHSKNNMEIVEEVKSGYTYKGIVTRASEVVVIKNREDKE